VAYQFANVLEHDLKIHKSSSSQNETKGKALASYICSCTHEGEAGAVQDGGRAVDVVN
jgi:hypothetical protein